MDLTGTGVEIDPTGKPSAEDRAEEFDAKLRELRGEYQGFYTAGFEDKNKAMREINDSRGMSGNAQNMMEDIHAYRDSKQSNLGGPKPFDPSATDDWYSAVEGWFKAVDDHIAQAESTGISQGGSKAVAWLGRTFIGEPLRALRELQDADLSQPPSTTQGGVDAIQKVTNVAANVGVLSTVAPAPRSALRTFGGRPEAENLAKIGFPEAETAFDIAEMMAKKGASEKVIRDTTRSLMEEAGLGGMSLGKDGKWRLEIPDKDMKLKVDFDKVKTGGYLDELVDHPLYFAAQPAARDIPVIIQKVHPNMKNFRASGGFDGENIHIVAQNGEQVLDILTHELSHFSAMKNKFPRGTDPAVVGEEAYLLNAGENTAVSSQARRDASIKELLDRPPYKDEQVPRDIQELESKPLKKAAGTVQEKANAGPYTKAYELDAKIDGTLKRIDFISEKLKREQSPSVTEQTRKQLMKEQDRLQKYQTQREAYGDIPPRRGREKVGPVVEVRESATRDISLGSPKSFEGTPEVKPTGSIKIKRLEDRQETLMALLQNDSSNKKALAELNKIQRELSKVKQRN